MGPTYSPDIFYLQSTAVDRTKMSAMLEAAALWKPTEKQSFKRDLAWQPVTLFYQPRSEDTVHILFYFMHDINLMLIFILYCY